MRAQRFVQVALLVIVPAVVAAQGSRGGGTRSGEHGVARTPATTAPAPRRSTDLWRLHLDQPRIPRRPITRDWGWRSYDPRPYWIDRPSTYIRRPFYGPSRLIIVSPYVGYDYAESQPIIREREITGSKVIDVGESLHSDSPAPVLEQLGDSLVRLRWNGDVGRVREISFVLADSARRILATQTVRAEPFTAIFDASRFAAFYGMTLIRADGVITTTLVPFTR
jgi:hypothetical protein